jgi:hypothetical protein
MKYLIYSLTLIFWLIGSTGICASERPIIEEDPGQCLYPNIRKVTNNFYASRIPNKNLTLVMERIDRRTHSLWQQYISVQSNTRAIEVVNNLKRGTTADGSLLFRDILDKVSYTKNEIWVAYITKSAAPQPIPDGIKYYCASNLDDSSDSFAKDIEMFVTVISSPNALITSHKGISMTIEGALGNRTKGTSVDLHSFAAKVMLMRNPQRKYMVNAPAFAMEKIIVDALPHSVFVGTQEMQQIMQERQNVAYEEFRAEHENLVIEKLREKAIEDSKRKNENLEHVISLLEEGRIENETEESLRKEAGENIPFHLMIEMKDGSFVISEQKLIANLPVQLEKEFRYFKNPYTFPTKELTNMTEEFLKFMEKYPPILSVDMERSIREHFTILNPEKPSEPVLSVDDKNREDYQWMFMEPCKPVGRTHYLVVDLRVLANSRPVE